MKNVKRQLLDRRKLFVKIDSIRITCLAEEGTIVLTKTAEQTVQEILAYRCPRYEEFSDLGLYKDQVVEALNRYAAPLLGFDDEPVITAAMINNYVKQQLLPAPVKKRYGREHLAYLYVICLLKRVFTISEIRGMLDIQTRTYPFVRAYDYFCVELEKALQAAFSTRDFSAPSSATQVTPESELVRTAAVSIAHKLFTAHFLLLYDQVPEAEYKAAMKRLNQNP